MTLITILTLQNVGFGKEEGMTFFSLSLYLSLFLEVEDD